MKKFDNVFVPKLGINTSLQKYRKKLGIKRLTAKRSTKKLATEHGKKLGSALEHCRVHIIRGAKIIIYLLIYNLPTN